MAHATLDEFKSAANVPPTLDRHDEEIEAILDAVSAQVNEWCSRDFAAMASSATARLFAPTLPSIARVDDFGTVTGLIVEVDESATGTWTTWASTYYQAEPLNSPQGAYWTLRALEDPLPVYGGRATLRVTAKWGWNPVPSPVKRATIIQTARILGRNETPFGVVGVDQLGAALRLTAALDVDVQTMLHAYRRVDAMVAP